MLWQQRKKRENITNTQWRNENPKFSLWFGCGSGAAMSIIIMYFIKTTIYISLKGFGENSWIKLEDYERKEFFSIFKLRNFPLSYPHVIIIHHCCTGPVAQHRCVTRKSIFFNALIAPDKYLYMEDQPKPVSYTLMSTDLYYTIVCCVTYMNELYDTSLVEVDFVSGNIKFTWMAHIL